MSRPFVDEIELAHVLRVLEPIWHSKTEAATRLGETSEIRVYPPTSQVSLWREAFERLMENNSGYHKIEALLSEIKADTNPYWPTWIVAKLARLESDMQDALKTKRRTVAEGGY